MRSMEAPPSPGVPTPADRDLTFRRLLGASTVSMLGSHMTTIAYPMLVLKLTGSPVVAGWVAFAAMAPSFAVYMPAGALIDRWDPRRTMLWSEVGRGVAISVVVITIFLRKTWVPLLIVAAVVEGILEVFSTLAERSCVGTVVERDQISSALVQMEGRTHAVLVVGRPLGGLLFGIDPMFPFLADVCTFIYSVSRLRKFRDGWAAGRTVGSYGEPRVNQHLGSDIWRGLAWLRDNRFAYIAIIIFSIGTFAFQALIMIFLADAHAERLSALSVGLVLAASGLGGTLGSVAASPLLKRAGYSWIKFQTLIWCLGFVVLWVSAGRPFLLMAAVMAVLGLTGALGNIELDTYLMKRVDRDMVARVTSISQLATFGACAVGPAVGGILVAEFGARPALFFLSIVMIPLVLLATVIPFSRLLHD
jgi:MFS family permease